MKFSVILNAYDTDKAQRHMTMACIAAMTKFTDSDFELIVVDNEPRWQIRDDYKVFGEYKTIVVDPKKTVYQSYNIGAEEATTKYLFFIQSDVFVHDRTLDKLMKYFKEYEMVFPVQHELSRKDTVKLLKTPDGTLSHLGQRDAGLIGITKNAFERAGRWDGRFQNLLGEKAFYQRCDEAGVKWVDRTNAIITHIMAGNNLKKDEKLYNSEMDYDAELGEKEYGW